MLINPRLTVPARPLSLDSETDRGNSAFALFEDLTNLKTYTFPKLVYLEYSPDQHRAGSLQALEQKSLCAAEFIGLHTRENHL